MGFLHPFHMESVWCQGQRMGISVCETILIFWKCFLDLNTWLIVSCFTLISRAPNISILFLFRRSLSSVWTSEGYRTFHTKTDVDNYIGEGGVIQNPLQSLSWSQIILYLIIFLRILLWILTGRSWVLPNSVRDGSLFFEGPSVIITVELELLKIWNGSNRLSWFFY